MRFAIRYIVLAIAVICFILTAVWLYGSPSKEMLRLSAGPPGGTYHAFATALAEVVNKRSTTVELKVMISAGSTENGARVSAQDAELGLIQPAASPSKAIPFVPVDS